MNAPQMHRPARSHSGAAVILIVLVLCTLIMGATFVSALYREGLHEQLVRSLAGHEIEHLALESLEEAHYLLAMGYPPAGSLEQGRQKIRAILQQGSTGTGPQDDPLPEESAAESGAVDHDANKFLRDSTSVIHFVPSALVSTLPRGHAAELAPVEIEVIERKVVRDITSPYAGEFQPNYQQLAQLGLPHDFTALKATWGILELRCLITLSGPRNRKIERRVIRRKLFAVFDFTLEGEDDPKSYAYIFPDPVGQVVERTASWKLLG